MRMITALMATTLTAGLPALAQNLPDGAIEIGRFTGTIEGKEITLLSTAFPEGENSDLEYTGMFDQYSLKTTNGFDKYAAQELPWLEIRVQPDPMSDDTETLRLDDLHLYTDDMFLPAYLAEAQSGYGTLTLENLETRKDGYISFDFSADMPKAIMNNANQVVPDPGGPPIHIEGHFEGTVPEWEMQ